LPAAGPVGVIAALALARQGIPVQVFEAEPRAATTHAATLEILDNLGLVDEVIRRGLVEPKFRIWNREPRQLIVEFDFGALKNDTRFPYDVQCEQHKLANTSTIRSAASALNFGIHDAVELADLVGKVMRGERRRKYPMATTAGGGR